MNNLIAAIEKSSTQSSDDAKSALATQLASFVTAFEKVFVFDGPTAVTSGDKEKFVHFAATTMATNDGAATTAAATPGDATLLHTVQVLKILTRTRTDLAPLYDAATFAALSRLVAAPPTTTTTAADDDADADAKADAVDPRFQALGVLLNCAIIDRQSMCATAAADVDSFRRIVGVLKARDDAARRVTPMMVHTILRLLFYLGFDDAVANDFILEQDGVVALIELFIAATHDVEKPGSLKASFTADTAAGNVQRRIVGETCKVAFNLAMDDRAALKAAQSKPLPPDVVDRFGKQLCALFAHGVTLPDDNDEYCSDAASGGVYTNAKAAGATWTEVAAAPVLPETVAAYLERCEDRDGEWRVDWRQHADMLHRVKQADERRKADEKAAAEAAEAAAGGNLSKENESLSIHDMVTAELAAADEADALQQRNIDDADAMLQRVEDGGNVSEAERAAATERRRAKYAETRAKRAAERAAEEAANPAPPPRNPTIASLDDVCGDAANLLIYLPMQGFLTADTRALQRLLNMAHAGACSHRSVLRDNCAPILMVLSTVAGKSRECRRFFRRCVFHQFAFIGGRDKRQYDVSMNPAGDAGETSTSSASTSPAALATLSLKELLLRNVTSFDAHIKAMTSELLWVVCDQDTHDYMRLTGFGNAVGLLADKGLPGFGHMKDNAVDMDDLYAAHVKREVAATAAAQPASVELDDIDVDATSNDDDKSKV
jgi:hypothetical protein